MITVYEAADPIDAQRVVDLLASEGIAAHVTGGYLSGAIGEVPAGGLVRVWVDDAQAEAALAVLMEDAAALPFVDDEDPDVADDDAPAAGTPPSPPRSLVLPVLGGMLLGVVMGFGMAVAHLTVTAETRPVDFDGDLEPDYFEDYQGDVLVTVRVDRNGDGHIDEVTTDASRSDQATRSDDDFDGRFESQLQYSNWMPARSEADLDGDGTREWRHEYKSGVAVTSTLHDPVTGALIKRISYAAGAPLLEEFDADGDGTLETVRHYDTRGEIKP